MTIVLIGAAFLAQPQVLAKPAMQPAVTLAGRELGFGPAKAAKATFGMAKAKAIEVASAALGNPTEKSSYPDCGQGIAIGYARFRGGLELTFIGGKFVGWVLSENGSAAMRTSRGIGLGATRAALQKAYPSVSIDADSSLGVQFSIDDDLGGFLSSDKPSGRVEAMQAGQVCQIS